MPNGNGSLFLLQTEKFKILVDCGMFQGKRTTRAKFPSFFLLIAEISAVFLTHAHIDHSGPDPAGFSNGFRGKIYTTCATANLCRIMLPDSGYIQEMEAEWLNRKARKPGGLKRSLFILWMKLMPLWSILKRWTMTRPLIWGSSFLSAEKQRPYTGFCHC